jgi:hypothetical protein
MAVEFYVEQADRSPTSGIANEDIYAGELVHDDGDGADVYVYADGDENVYLARYDAQSFAREYEDEVREDKYVAGDEQRNRVQEQPVKEGGARLRIRTPNDNGTDPAPSITDGDAVGVIDAAGGTASSAAEFQGRIVEEGYTDDAATTYDRASGNFRAIGEAYRPARQNGDTMDEFDYPVRVELFGELQED